MIKLNFVSFGREIEELFVKKIKKQIVELSAPKITKQSSIHWKSLVVVQEKRIK